MKLLVTGGGGFIGSHLIDALIKNGNYVICIDDFSVGSKNNIHLNGQIHCIDNKLQELEISDIDDDIQGIFHLAAQASVPVSLDNFYLSSENNLLSTLKAFDIAKEFEIPIIYASSSSVYGNMPVGNDELIKTEILSPYGQDKLTLEQYAKLCWKVYNIPSIGLRFFNVYGPRQDPSNPYSGVISIFIDRLLKRKPVRVNGGYQTRDFIYVSDIVDTMITSMNLIKKKKMCEILNVGTGKSTTIDGLLGIIANILEIKPKKILKDLPAGDPERSDGKYNKLQLTLNMNIKSFLDLESGLRKTIEYMEKDFIND